MGHQVCVVCVCVHVCVSVCVWNTRAGQASCIQSDASFRGGICRGGRWMSWQPRVRQPVRTATWPHGCHQRERERERERNTENERQTERKKEREIERGREEDATVHLLIVTFTQTRVYTHTYARTHKHTRTHIYTEEEGGTQMQHIIMTCQNVKLLTSEHHTWESHIRHD